jgi:glutamate racemase
LNKIKVGVFDSGVGGLSVVKAIKNEIPELQIIYKDDKKNIPYGNKSVKQLMGFVVPIFQDLENQGCKVIVVACNTVTTTIIEDLRKIVKIPLVAIEPMVKPAALATKTGVIAVCATPATLQSNRYKDLKILYAKNITVIEPDCSDWARMIESASVSKERIDKTVQEAIDAGADVIVLGCTHYHWIEEEIKSLVHKKALVIQPEKPLVRQLKRVLARLV